MKTTPPISFQEASEYLKVADYFKLGDLPSESQHPDTLELSNLAQNNLKAAITTIHQVDVRALDVLCENAAALEPLKQAIAETLSKNDRVFLCGCGATGRLALSLEFLWRKSCNATQSNSVISFMAGGDVAMVRSIENFEDHPEFGERQLKDLGFRNTDLLISTTEGGETPFVIGATEFAARFSARAPFFLYCNPKEILEKLVSRSRNVFENPNIKSIALPVGPMVLSGSTRLQASTVLMAAVGLCLLPEEVGRPLTVATKALRDFIAVQDFAEIRSLIEAESQIYKSHKSIFYESDEYGITVLTDTTERHPTFSIAPFENILDLNVTPPVQPSICYLISPQTQNAHDSWTQILGRTPRPLDWKGFESRVSEQRLLGFDFSEQTRIRRLKPLPPDSHSLFRISKQAGHLNLELESQTFQIPVPSNHLLFEHLVLKVALNIHSTLVMGRLHRYQGNVMTWVKPSNGKLIDRAIRYVAFLFKIAQKQAPDYNTICFALFEQMGRLQPDQSVVIETFKTLSQRPSP